LLHIAAVQDDWLKLELHPCKLESIIVVVGKFRVGGIVGLLNENDPVKPNTAKKLMSERRVFMARITRGFSTTEPVMCGLKYEF